MGLAFVLQLFSQWQMQLVSAFAILLLPLVSYLASGRPRPQRPAELPPAEKALRESTE